MSPILQKNLINEVSFKALHTRSQKRLFAYYAALALILVSFQLFFTASASAFQTGDRVKATENLNVRNCTFLWCSVIGVIPAGGTGKIISGSYYYDNYTWWGIAWDNGLTGFSVQNYLAALPGTFSLSHETPVCDTGSPGPSPAVRLNWTTCKNANYYDVYRNGSLYASSNTGNTFYNSANLVAGRSYTYFIKARNSSGSQNSNTISVNIPSDICDSATIPASFTLNQPSTSCNSTNPQISLSWGSSSGAASYNVYRNGVFYANAFTSLTYKNTSVSSGTTYAYFIRASNSAGYRDSNTVTATAPNCVASPQITIGPSLLNFGNVQTGSCSSAQFAVQHVVDTGTASGTVSISQNPPFRVTSNSSFSLSNSQAVNVNVKFCPTSSGSFSGTAVINSNADQNINSVNLSGTGVSPSPTTGVIQVNAKLDGTSWSGSVNYSISGAQNFSGNSVSADFQDRPQGNYTLAYVSGGPGNSTFSSITPSSSQTLNGEGVITFTLNFIAQTSNQSPEAKFTMTSGGQTTYENQTLNLTVSSGGTAQVSFSGSRSSDPDGSISSYLWKINGIQVSTSRDFSSSLGKGTHQVYLTVTDNKGAAGSVGANIVIEETTTSTTTTSTTTTSTTTSTTSTTSTPTSTTSTTTTTLPVSSTITTISFPGIKYGFLPDYRSQDRYEFKISSSSPIKVTISLFSAHFNTFLTLYKGDTGHKLAEDDNGHVDWGDFETDDVLGTNSEISGSLPSGTYTIGVTSSEIKSGNYYLVVRDIGYDTVETFCEKRWEKYPAVFPGPSHAYGTPNDWVAKSYKIGGDDCFGRCGDGCTYGLNQLLSCANLHRYTIDCFNHDACCDYYKHDTLIDCNNSQCWRIFDNCLSDCVFAEDCGGPLNVGKSDSCDYSTLQDAIDAANSGGTLNIQEGIYSEHLTSTPKTVILRGGWDETFSTNSSTSTVNSLTVTDGKVIVENLVIQ